jgi:hypothetical protein
MTTTKRNLPIPAVGDLSAAGLAKAGIDKSFTIVTPD